VEYQELRRSRRLLDLLSINLEPPPPLLRRKIDQQGSFKVTRSQEIVPKPSPRGEHSNPEESIIFYLGVEALRPYNPPITNLLVQVLIQVVPPRVTHHEHQIVLQAVMEKNLNTSSRSPHTPSTTATTGGVPPPNSPL
jgi:hypothetical protein